MYIRIKQTNLTYRMLSAFIAFTFIFSAILPSGYAQVAPHTVLNLPIPGSMVSVSNGFNSAIIRGITIHPENPLEFDFIVDRGDNQLDGQELEDQALKMIKYFLAALTVPKDELWVNLSPYEQDRIITKGFGDTEMGRDLLAQDYLLKQLASSLMYPEDELGKKFWDRVYKRAYEQFGTTEIPMNTFNKIWIVPDKAVVYEHHNSVFVVDRHLKVMLEEDYIALSHNKLIEEDFTPPTERQEMIIDKNSPEPLLPKERLTTDIIREVMLPAIEKEINEGETFANLRQIYNSMILAIWYKQNLKKSLLGQVYVDKNKTKGVDTKDKSINQKIYDQYIESFKKGVYDYIKEDYDPARQQMIPKKYFSGGATAPHEVTVANPVEAEKSLGSSPVNSGVKFRVELVGKKAAAGWDGGSSASPVAQTKSVVSLLSSIEQALDSDQELAWKRAEKAFRVLGARDSRDRLLTAQIYRRLSDESREKIRTRFSAQTLGQIKWGLLQQGNFSNFDVEISEDLTTTKEGHSIEHQLARLERLIEDGQLTNVTADVFNLPEQEGERQLMEIPLFDNAFETVANVVNQSKGDNSWPARGVSIVRPTLPSIRDLLPRMIARHIPKNLAVSHFRVVSVNVTKLKADPHQIKKKLISLLGLASRAGDTAVVLDLDSYHEYTHPTEQHNSPLDKVLIAWKNMENPAPLLVMASPSLHLSYKSNAVRYSDLVQAEIQLDDHRYGANGILETEVRVIEQRFNVTILKEAVDYIFRTGIEIEEAVEILSDLASEAELKSQANVLQKDAQALLEKRLGANVALERLYEIRKHLMPPNVRDEADKLIVQIRNADFLTDTNKTTNRLEILVKWPWQERTDGEIDHARARQILMESHYGMKKAKESILEYLMLLDHLKQGRGREGRKKIGKILLLDGPPGVGKTTLAEAFADAMGRKFLEMPLGGLNDESQIKGHSSTYIGAVPGNFVRLMVQGGVRDPVMLLDEIEKMAVGGEARGDPYAALLLLLDPRKNHKFRDNFVGPEIDLDFSEVTFIATSNDVELLRRKAPALLDRMEVINLSGYTLGDKVEMAKGYIIPRQLEEYELEKSQVSFSDDALKHLIKGYTSEAGARQLERLIASIIRKAIVEMKSKESAQISIDEDKILEYLGRPQHRKEKLKESDRIGLSNGLKVTQGEGTFVPVEATIIDTTSVKQRAGLVQRLTSRKGKEDEEFEIEVFNTLGEVENNLMMHDSFAMASQYLKSELKGFGINLKDLKGKRALVNVPFGETPLDVHFLGFAIATAVISAITEIPIKRDVAMIGGISQIDVGEVGKLKEKLLGALEAGITKVIIPAANHEELLDVYEDAPNIMAAVAGGELEIVEVSTMGAVLQHALTEPIGVGVGSSSPLPQREVGGINFNPDLFNLQIERNSNGVPLSVWQQPIDPMNMDIEGFLPVIIGVTPFSNLRLLLGLTDQKEPFAACQFGAENVGCERAMFLKEPEEILL